METYREYEVTPLIEIFDNAFKITLPNTNQKLPKEDTPLTENEYSVLSLLKEDYILSRREMQKMLGLSQTTIIVTLASLLEKKLIEKGGNGNRTKYRRASKV